MGQARVTSSVSPPRAEVLVVEPDPSMGERLRAALVDEGYAVSLTGDASGGLLLAQERRFDLALVSLQLADDGTTPGLLAGLRAIDPAMSVVLSAAPTAAKAVARCMRRGAWGHVRSPVQIDELKIQVERALEHRELRATVALYESTQALLASLSTYELRRDVLTRAREVLRSPTAVLLMSTPDAETHWDVCAEGPDDQDAIQLSERLFLEGNRLPRLPWSGSATARTDAAGVTASRAFDPVAAYPLHARARCFGLLVALRRVGDAAFTETEQRRGRQYATQAALALDNARIYAALESIAVIDELTGLHSRRYLLDIIRRSSPETVAEGTSYLMVDVDHFKVVNDTYGHAVGDRVLRKVADLLMAATRDTDVVARVGGEEFAVLLPHTDEETATDIAERVRATIALRSECPRVTVSVGVASLPAARRCEGDDPVESASTLMERADVALYRAKRAGRNRVCVWHARRQETLASGEA